jgi:acyl transferase domain-containing protein
MLLEMTWTALEDAGVDPLKLKGSRTGVFVGIWRMDYEKLYRGSGGSYGKDGIRDYLGTSLAAACGRISLLFGLTGASMNNDSGCSSALMSVYQACHSLNSGESTLAIAGGANLLLVPFNEMTFHPVLSPDGHCKTFDEKADGYGRAEGCGILILKKYSDAVRDGDRVLALIKGIGVSHEGTSTSFGTPSKKGQVLAIERAFEFCGLDPAQVDYLEAHGTGTIKGDLVEISAISEVYSKGRKDPLIVGSVKTNIGHTESVAGVAGIIKVILAMNKRIIPPHINLDKVSPLIGLDYIPCVIPKAPMEWEKTNGQRRCAGVSSFGISGANLHCLLQEADYSPNVGDNKNLVRPAHILTLSTKTEGALDVMIQEYISFLSKNPDLSLEDVCYSANTGRAHFPHRISVFDSTLNGTHQITEFDIRE